MALFAIVRLVFYLIAAFLSLVVLGLAGHSFSLTQAGGGYYTFDALAIAVSVFTPLIVVPVLIVDRIRKNAVVSWTAIELGWAGFFKILWLATAASTASVFAGASCGADSDGTIYTMDQFIFLERRYAEQVCSESLATMGISFIIWIIFFAMFLHLLVLAIRANAAGHKYIWRTSAAEYNAGAVGFRPGANTVGAYPMNQLGQGYGAGPALPPAGQYGQYGQAYNSVPNPVAMPAYAPISQDGGYRGASQV